MKEVTPSYTVVPIISAGFYFQVHRRCTRRVTKRLGKTRFEILRKCTLTNFDILMKHTKLGSFKAFTGAVT